MMLDISHPNGILKGEIEVPLSKSILNRLLIAQALGKMPLYQPVTGDANDVHVLYRALIQLQHAKDIIRIDVEDAGTPFRFLTAYCSSKSGLDVVLDGTHRLKQRPIKALVDALRTLGADITYLEQEYFAPIRIRGKELKEDSVILNSDESSQFVSALCLVAPSLSNGLTIHYNPNVVSFSYIEMTLYVMRQMGIEYSHHESCINIKHQSYQETNLRFGDWSSASFFYAAALLASQSDICISNLSRSSSQGDEKVVEILRPFGVKTISEGCGIHIQSSSSLAEYEPSLLDMSSTPDLAVPLMVVMACKYPKVSFCGIDHLRLKESDRIATIQTELAKLGVYMNFESGRTSIAKRENNAPSKITISSHNDHRIAMSFAMLSLLGIQVRIQGAECVSKSFPQFWETISRLGFLVKEH